MGKRAALPEAAKPLEEPASAAPLPKPEAKPEAAAISSHGRNSIPKAKRGKKER